jgi:hypothetical protein
MTNASAAPPAADPRRTRALLWGVGGAVIALLVYTAAWLVTAFLLQRNVTVWLQAARDGGYDVAATVGAPAGFPGRVRVAVRDITVKAPDRDGGWTWKTAKLRIIARPLGLTHLQFDLSGQQSIGGGVPMPLWIVSPQTDLALDLDLHGKVQSAALTAVTATAGLVENQPLLHLDHGAATLTLLQSSTSAGNAPTQPASARVAVDVTGVGLPFPLPAPLNQPIARAAATLEITGTLPATGLLPEVLNAWRAAGGTLEVRAAELDWPPLHMTMNGTAALDDQLQPMGSFTLHFQGGNAVLDALAQGGWMGQDETTAAKVGLALLSKTGADGVTPELEVPLTIQDRTVAAGPATLMTLPRIQWAKVGVE